MKRLMRVVRMMTVSAKRYGRRETDFPVVIPHQMVLAGTYDQVPPGGDSGGRSVGVLESWMDERDTGIEPAAFSLEAGIWLSQRTRRAQGSRETR